MHRIFLLPLLLFSFLLTGCGVQDTQTFKSTVRFYNTHINRPVKVDLAEMETLDAAPEALVSRMASIDLELTKLERSLDAIPSPNDEKYIQALAKRVQWISAVYFVNGSGSVEASMPAAPMKALDFSYLTAQEIQPRRFYSAIVDSPLGAEVVIARPYFQGSDLQGFLCVSFDMRNLLQYTDASADLLIFTPDQPLWTGDVVYSDSVLAAVDWKQELKSDSFGMAKSKNGDSTVWLVRYLGDLPIIFAVANADGEKK